MLLDLEPGGAEVEQNGAPSVARIMMLSGEMSRCQVRLACTSSSALKSGTEMRSSSSWVGGLSSPCSHFSSVLPLTKSSSM